jgi:hypothetical protein
MATHGQNPLNKTKHPQEQQACWYGRIEVDLLAWVLNMDLSAMVRTSGRVAVFAAIAALLFQVSCSIGLPLPAAIETAALAGPGCHDSMPAAPKAPQPDHRCCAAEHSYEALLTPTTTPMPPAVVEVLLNPAFDVASIPGNSAEIAILSSAPPVPFALRI